MIDLNVLFHHRFGRELNQLIEGSGGTTTTTTTPASPPAGIPPSRPRERSAGRTGLFIRDPLTGPLSRYQSARRGARAAASTADPQNARRDTLSYVVSLLRAHKNEHCDTLPDIDVGSLKHIGDASFCSLLCMFQYMTIYIEWQYHTGIQFVWEVDVFLVMVLSLEPDNGDLNNYKSFQHPSVFSLY